MNLFISNLPLSTRDEDLEALFTRYGAVTGAKVILDRETRQSRGFGFVELADETAVAAIAGLDGSLVDGRAIRVIEARTKEERGGNDLHSTGGGSYSSGGDNSTWSIY